MKKTIAISTSPNTQNDDVLLALKVIFSPWEWLNKKRVIDLESEFEKRYLGFKAVAINSGRSAEYIVLKALGIKKGDEVIVQAFTCVAVPNSIIWLGAKPIYVDIDKTFNIDIEDLNRKITAKTKVIIVQNTFGVPANFNEIRKIVAKRKIKILADCAHSLGATYKGNNLCELADISFFSFGRDKIISSVFGGLILCKDSELSTKLMELQDDLKNPPLFWVLQQLFHPVAFIIIKPLYNFFDLGKLLLYIFQKLGLLSKAIYPLEKKAERPDIFPSRMPGGLAILARHQFLKLEDFNIHRIRIAKFYLDKLDKSKFKLPDNVDGSVWLRFPVITKNRNKIMEDLKVKGILLGDWYKDILSPSKNLDVFGYIKGSCKNAESYSAKILNLPTYPNMTINDASYIVRLLNNE